MIVGISPISMGELSCVRKTLPLSRLSRDLHAVTTLVRPPFHISPFFIVLATRIFAAEIH